MFPRLPGEFEPAVEDCLVFYLVLFPFAYDSYGAQPNPRSAKWCLRNSSVDSHVRRKIALMLWNPGKSPPATKHSPLVYTRFESMVSNRTRGFNRRKGKPEIKMITQNRNRSMETLNSGNSQYDHYVCGAKTRQALATPATCTEN